MNGKGDKPRPTDGEKYRRNYERIFGKDERLADAESISAAIQSQDPRKIIIHTN